MRVAVVGATGYVGGRLVPHLLAAGHDVRCLARQPARLDGVPWRSEVDVTRADALDEASLKEGLDGVDVVYYLVHAMGQADDFSGVDRIGAANLARAAADAAVARIVYLGGLGDDGDALLSTHLTSRHEVGRVLASGPVPVTELRAAVIIGSGSASFEMLRSLVEVLPVMVCPRWVTKTKCQPIAIRDVLHYLTAVSVSPGTAGKVLEIGGPDVLTYREMMDRYAAIAGLPRRFVVPVPVLSPRLSSHWVNLVTALPFGLARPLVDSLVSDVYVRPELAIGRYIDHEPIGFDAAIEQAIRKVKDLDIRTSWTDSLRAPSPAEPMVQDPHWAGGTLYEDVQVVDVDAPPHEVFRVVSGVGGDRGWYVAPLLWAIRGAMDEAVGGVGMRRGRRHPDELRVGDALDFFRVEEYRPDRLLRLRAEMKVPGSAWLEWTVEPAARGTRLRQLARFSPLGVAGRAYWYTLLPVHSVIFRRLAERLAETAEERVASTRPR